VWLELDKDLRGDASGFDVGDRLADLVEPSQFAVSRSLGPWLIVSQCEAAVIGASVQRSRGNYAPVIAAGYAAASPWLSVRV
jgi:hypothetical protein